MVAETQFNCDVINPAAVHLPVHVENEAVFSSADCRLPLVPDIVNKAKNPPNRDVIGRVGVRAAQIGYGNGFDLPATSTLAVEPEVETGSVGGGEGGGGDGAGELSVPLPRMTRAYIVILCN